MTQIRFFSTASDIRKVLDMVESKESLQYWKTCNVEVLDECKMYHQGNMIPNLGTALSDSAISCDEYVVCAVGVSIRVREMLGVRGERRFLIDQFINPDSVTLRPAGVHVSSALLEGRVGTASTSPAARRLMAVFRSAISKAFARVEDVWVGAEAFEMFRRGSRLTQSIHSDEQFDLPRRRT